jgi:hypothetical protein
MIIKNTHPDAPNLKVIDADTGEAVGGCISVDTTTGKAIRFKYGSRSLLIIENGKVVTVEYPGKVRVQKRLPTGELVDFPEE